MTKKQRHTTYKKALKTLLELHPDSTLGICWCIDDSRPRGSVSPYAKGLEAWHELAAMKPPMEDDEHHWWPFGPAGRAERVKALEKMIEASKP